MEHGSSAGPVQDLPLRALTSMRDGPQPRGHFPRLPGRRRKVAARIAQDHRRTARRGRLPVRGGQGAQAGEIDNRMALHQVAAPEFSMTASALSSRPRACSTQPR
jgi:hypothetical protein